ncbi:MAG: hypothetical protein ACYS7Y_23730, partial [Planctomycetota bacterium]
MIPSIIMVPPLPCRDSTYLRPLRIFSGVAGTGSGPTRAVEHEDHLHGCAFEIRQILRWVQHHRKESAPLVAVRDEGRFYGLARDFVAQDEVLVGDAVETAELDRAPVARRCAVGYRMARAGEFFNRHARVDIEGQRDIVPAALVGFQVLDFR